MNIQPVDENTQSVLEGKKKYMTRSDIDVMLSNLRDKLCLENPEKWHDVSGQSSLGLGWEGLIERLNDGLSARGTDRYEIKRVKAGVDGKGDPAEKTYLRYTCGITPEE